MKTWGLESHKNLGLFFATQISENGWGGGNVLEYLKSL
jgi:hypothetical protein